MEVTIVTWLKREWQAVVVSILVIGSIFGAIPMVASTMAVGEQVDDGAEQAPDNRTANGTVQVGVGQQLSTIISATSDDTRTSFENMALEFSFERANETERAQSIADRAEELRDKAVDIREDYRSASEALAEGDISRSEYAQRLATLNARARNVLSSVERLQGRAQGVSALELRAAGLNRTRLNDITATLENVTGTGPTALLQRFTGQRQGEVKLEVANGLSVEVEGEDGERSREIKRPRDADQNITISGRSALESARASLSNQSVPWSLRKASVHQVEGYYKFEFGFRTANETGEAEVRVDGSTGNVFRIEEEIELRDDDEGPLDADDPEPPFNDTEDEAGEEPDDEDDTEIDDLAMVLASGTPQPGANVTVQVLGEGGGVANATVFLNGASVGSTDENGYLTVTLPDTKTEIVAKAGGEDAELEFEFEEEDDDAFRNLNVSVTIDNRTAIVSVTFNGSPVSNAEVYVNNELAGTTSSSGQVTASLSNDTVELEIEVVKGEYEAEVEFELEDGTAVQSGEVREDDERDEADGDDDDADEADEDEGDEDEEEEGEGAEEEDDESDGDDTDDDDDGSSGSGSGDDEEEDA